MTARQARTARTNKQRVARTTSQTVQTVREARSALQRVTDHVSARSRYELVDKAGEEIPDRVRLTDAEREQNLRIALTWLNEAEQQTRLVRSLVERLHEYHLNEAIR